MPTGYTAAVGEGKVTAFPEFALSCARAFGALVMMRDDPMDATIPEEFQPSDYHENAIAKARKRLDAVRLLTDAECDAKAEAVYRDALAYRAKTISERAAIKSRYEAMLAKVRTWIPPTPDHRGMKEFMEKQLLESIDWDCDTSYYEKEPVHMSGVEWRDAEVVHAEEGIAYHEKHHAEEVERTSQRNAWVKALRESLK